jgi:MoaA/NifB/PqqE/SkfB family radical SAM enzyme
MFSLKPFGIIDRIPNSVKWDLMNLYHSGVYNTMKLLSGQDIFYEVYAETNTECNRKCKTCPQYHSNKEPGYMDTKLYDTLLDQLSDLDFSGNFAPVSYNEPLLDERLPDLMASTRKKIPRSHIVVYTNGSLLTEGKVKSLVDSGVDTIFVSQYEGNLPRDDARSLIKSLPRDMGRHIRYRVLTEDMTLFNRGGTVDVKNPARMKRCFYPSTIATVDYKGNVVFCTNDYFSEHVMGNIGYEHIKDIWEKEGSKRNCARNARASCEGSERANSQSGKEYGKQSQSSQ